MSGLIKTAIDLLDDTELFGRSQPLASEDIKINDIG
jgi:hypothetical protein